MTLPRSKTNNKQQIDAMKEPLYNTDYDSVKDKFILRCNTVLQFFTEKGSVTFTELQEKFSEVSNESFKSQFLRIKANDPDYAITSIVDNAFLPKHDCFLEYGSNSEPYISFKPKDLSRPKKKNVPSTSNSVENTPVLGGNKNREQNPIQRDLMPYTYEMFSEPIFLSWCEEAREYNRKRFIDFMKIAKDAPPKDTEVQKKARHLAQEFWAQKLRFFPHIMYLLRQLSIKKPNGFHLNNFEEEMEAVIPDSWRIIREDLCFENLETGPTDVMSLNLLMGCDEDDAGMMVVNKAVDYLGFHEIRDHEVSMIYHYLSSTRHPKTTKSIHTFMCDDYPGWKNFYNENSSMKRIEDICRKNDKMFGMQDNKHFAKSHAYKIPVPMSFSPFLVHKGMGIS
ncbi:unnamed protein product [Caenorhabditis brenneri]